MRYTGVILCSMATLLSGQASAADWEASSPAKMAPADQVPPFPAWEAFVDGLRDLWPKMVEKMPERMRNDPQMRQEAGRLMLEAMTARTIEAIGADPDHPVFLPHLNNVLNVFQPNADTTYVVARITPGGTYRLRGKLGSLRILKLGQFGPTLIENGGPTRAMAYNDFNELKADAKGDFDVIMSAARPAGYSGDWWELNPEASMLMVRQVISDLKTEEDPRIAIERLDAPVERPRPSAADLESRLRWLVPTISNTATFFVDHVEGLRNEGYINKFKIFDVVTSLAGLVGQFYYEGAYELKPDEALIVESTVPKKCGYSSLILTNDIYETTDWYNNLSSLNDSQVRVDGDGILRVVVSEKDPGVPNWLDTAGYPTGAVQGRWTDCDSQPIPKVRKVALQDVRKSLPADTPTVTPEQRERQIRDRRARLQQRPLW